jgi:hypothetical protein
MSTQPLSQEFGVVSPRILKCLPVADGKQNKKRKTTKRASDLSKKLRAKPKERVRKARTEEVALPELEALRVEETIEMEAAGAEILATNEAVLATCENLAANCGASEPSAEPAKDEPNLVSEMPTDSALPDNSFANELYAADEAVVTPMAAFEAAELVEQLPSAPIAEPVQLPKPVLSALRRMWEWIQQKFSSQQARKRLRVCETVSLGEKRFLAVIQVDGQEFLVGGSSTSVSTLAHLDSKGDFSDALRRSCEQGLSRA